MKVVTLEDTSSASGRTSTTKLLANIAVLEDTLLRSSLDESGMLPTETTSAIQHILIDMLPRLTTSTQGATANRTLHILDIASGRWPFLRMCPRRL